MDFYQGDIPQWLEVISKDKVKVTVSDWRGQQIIEVTPKDVVEYYHSQARNITCGMRCLAGHYGDWRPIDNLAKELLELFKVLNKPALEKEAGKYNVTHSHPLKRGAFR